MFESVRIPKKLAHSPIDQAVFEIRYDGDYPGEALYGVLFEVFKNFPDNDIAELPIMQFPKYIRENDPSLRYQVYYKVSNEQFVFAIGPHSIVFLAQKPYPGWDEWKLFFKPIINEIKKKEIIRFVERISLRYSNIFAVNIFNQINAGLTIAGKSIITNPVFFCVEFDQNEIHTIINPITNSLIDVDCINTLDCNAEHFYSSYQDVIEKIHQVNENVFFGLLKEELLNSLKPEY